MTETLKQYTATSNKKPLKAKKVSKATSDKAKRKRLEIGLDNLWKEIARGRWGNQCAWRGCINRNSLAAHHYFHKAQGTKARWHPFNNIMLCYGHHIHQVHSKGDIEPIREIIIEKIGIEQFEKMKDEVHKVWKPTLSELEALRDEFSKILE